MSTRASISIAPIAIVDNVLTKALMGSVELTNKTY